MAFDRKRLTLLTVLLGLALVGLTAVQVSLLSRAFRSEKQAFADNVRAALAEASLRLAANETVTLAFNRPGKPSALESDSLVIMADVTVLEDADSSSRRAVLNVAHRRAPDVSFGDSSVTYRLESPQRVQIYVLNPSQDRQTVVLDTFSTAGTHEFAYRYKIEGCDPSDLFWKFVSDSSVFVTNFGDSVMQWHSTPPAADTGRQLFVRSVLQQLDLAELKPIDERVSVESLDSTLAAAFRRAGISLSYGFGVVDPGVDSVVLAGPAGQPERILASPFRARLFPHNLLSDPYDLAVYFPDHTQYIWRQIGVLAVPTVVLMLIVAAGFVYTIRTIVMQRRLAGLMVDFINNMTHEFKTPIATVQLASQAIDRDDILQQPDRIKQFNRMIQSETRRMKNQADRILQMAVVEDGELDLAVEPVDLHAVLTSLAASVRLQVEGRGGRIDQHLSADKSVVDADPVHLTNVLNNLLDNAVKYSREKPHVTIFTSNSVERIEIQVSDRGVGVSETDQKMVFEKFFRVPQGNIHDVKGFGLGLSYVKLIVEALGGTVEMKSRVGVGTTVTVNLPLSGREKAQS
jgi:signal transduction histidine kinase